MYALDMTQLATVHGGGFDWNRMVDNGNRYAQVGAVAGGGVGLVAGGAIGGAFGSALGPLGTAAGIATGAATGAGIGGALGALGGWVGGAAYDAVKQTGYHPKFHTPPK